MKHWNEKDYACPIGVSCLIVNSCSGSSTSSSSYGSKSYQETLAHSIGASVSVKKFGIGGSFSASKDFSETTSRMEEHRYHYYHVQAACTMYNLRLKAYDAQEQTLSDEFKRGVASLVVMADDDTTIDQTYYDFITNYGTHYTTALNSEWGRSGERILMSFTHHREN